MSQMVKPTTYGFHSPNKVGPPTSYKWSYNPTSGVKYLDV